MFDKFFIAFGITICILFMGSMSMMFYKSQVLLPSIRNVAQGHCHERISLYEHDIDMFANVHNFICDERIMALDMNTMQVTVKEIEK